MRTAPSATRDLGVCIDPITKLLAPPVEVDREPTAIILRPANPSLGQRECPMVLEAAAEVLESIDRRVRFLVLDLSNINTFSAMGIGLCQDLAKRAKEKRLKPVLFGLEGPLLDQLRMFRIDSMYTVVRSRGDLVTLTGG